MAKRMRLPNGFGQISKINKPLRNKFRAMVTTGWSDEGKPKRKIVGYFPTYNEAYKALMKYHDNPSILCDIDMQDLYEKWSSEHFKRITQPDLYERSWRLCQPLYAVKVKDCRASNIKAVVEADMPPSMHIRVKSMLSLMFDYAIENDYCEKNYARIATTHIEHKHKNHIAYTDDELKTLWESQSVEGADFVLVSCYTGFRPNELLGIKKENVNINEWYITGGLKTAAGRDRVVPIHDRIKPFILRWYEEGNENLIEGVKYHLIRYRFLRLIDKISLNPEHKLHDGRVTFVTRMKDAGADEYAIKRIIGHQIKDITEKIYTERTIEFLRGEISKLV